MKGHTEAAVAQRVATRIGQPVAEVLEHRAAGRAWCWVCRSWKPRAEFYEDRTNCKPCHVALTMQRKRSGGCGSDPDLHSAKVQAAKLGMALDDVLARRGAGLRRCWRCKEWKPREDFPADRHRPSQCGSACKGCAILAVRESKMRRASGGAAVERLKPLPPPPPLGSCGECTKRPARFLLKDGTPACARCLRARVKERKSEQRSST